MRRASALSFHGGPEFHPGVDPRLTRDGYVTQTFDVGDIVAAHEAVEAGKADGLYRSQDRNATLGRVFALECFR
jgi:hypothetical protein